ncbi:hypothetical protein IE53DRAFT_192001 [Violaceomyces palustris]|uniref:Uncharacterized protein n=1 Tax=Violaceomyces palustris TaxID=1673888 RepID=A0ACD0NS20_9BASI|nr:hypothetical protein IE53DRAFT_192001 [Violaceomyces palustris]
MRGGFTGDRPSCHPMRLPLCARSVFSFFFLFLRGKRKRKTPPHSRSDRSRKCLHATTLSKTPPLSIHPHPAFPSPPRPVSIHKALFIVFLFSFLSFFFARCLALFVPSYIFFSGAYVRAQRCLLHMIHPSEDEILRITAVTPPTQACVHLIVYPAFPLLFPPFSFLTQISCSTSA